MSAVAPTQSASSEAYTFLVENLARVLGADRTREIQETVEIVCSAKNVFVYGVGRSGLAARAFAMRLVQLGIDCYFIGETITPIVKLGDLCVIVSNTGTTMSAVQTANIARRVGARVLAVTGNPHSKLAQAANIAIEIREDRDARRPKLAPLATLFETAALVLFDGIVADVMRELGESEASMRSRHAIMV